LVKTPNLDRLARGGSYFRNFITASPVCSPARVSAFTGRYPKTHGVRINLDPIRDAEVLLPRLLKRHGYRTGMAGKLHLAEKDAAGLFEYQQEAPGSQYAAYLKEKHPNRSLNEATRPELIKDPGFVWKVGASVLPVEDFPTHWIADRAIDFIRDGGEQPWFCFASFWKPHSPFILPMPWASKYSPRDVALPDLPEEKATPPTALNKPRHYVTASQTEQLKRVRAAYYGAISFVDEQIGRILRELRRSGQWENTIIVFTSDHGNSLGEGGRMFKETPYEGAVRVPMIVHYPKAIEPGTLVDRPFDTTAIMPTLLDLAGLEVPKGFESPSMRPWISGEETGSEGDAFTEMLFRTVRSERWKLTDPGDHPTWEPQLFDLESDRDEKNNLYGKPEAAAAQAELSAKLEEWYERKPPRVQG